MIDAPTAASALHDMFGTARWVFHEASGPLSPTSTGYAIVGGRRSTSVDGGKPRVWLRGEFAGAIKRSA